MLKRIIEGHREAYVPTFEFSTRTVPFIRYTCKFLSLFDPKNPVEERWNCWSNPLVCAKLIKLIELCIRCHDFLAIALIGWSIRTWCLITPNSRAISENSYYFLFFFVLLLDGWKFMILPEQNISKSFHLQFKSKSFVDSFFVVSINYFTVRKSFVKQKIFI